MRPPVRSSERHRGPIRRLLKHLFCEEQWGVGLLTPDAFWRSVEKGELSDTDICWLEIPSSCFLADPCWLSEPHGLFLAERLEFRRRVGRIVLCRVEGAAVQILCEL